MKLNAPKLNSSFIFLALTFGLLGSFFGLAYAEEYKITVTDSIMLSDSANIRHVIVIIAHAFINEDSVSFTDSTITDSTIITTSLTNIEPESFIPLAFAQDTTVQDEDNGGIAPDNILWGLDVAIDRLRLLFASSESEKASLGLEIAGERLREVKAMIAQNKFENANQARAEHALFLGDAEIAITKIEIETVNSAEEFETKIRLGVILKRHALDIENLDKDFTNRLRTLSDVSTTDINFAKGIISLVNADAERIRIVIDEEKSEAKIRFKEETKKTDFQVENFENEMKFTIEEALLVVSTSLDDPKTFERVEIGKTFDSIYGG